MNFIQAENTLQEAVERFWKLDDPIHINDNAWSATDKQVVHLWKKQAVKEDNHYTLPIPFKDYPPHLPSNYAMAKHRLDLLRKRLRRDVSLKQKYTEGVHDYLSKGYAQRVTNIDREDGCVWYLPHHPVIHPRKPGKVRIVFDCCARYQGTSLNDSIYQGPGSDQQVMRC